MTLIDEAPTPAAARPGSGRRRLLAVVLAAATVLGCVVGAQAVFGHKSAKLPTGAISEATMEDRYGVRIDLVALTALGGLAQLRFTVLDKNKADELFHANKPKLMAETNGTILSAPEDAAHKMTLLDGAGYFLFYANAGDVLHSGDKVSIVIDGVRLEHLVVKS